MSGEHPRDDEPDFLDDDFVLEDDAAFGDLPALPERSVPAGETADGDLDELFEAAKPARASGGDGDDAADDDEELFAMDEPRVADNDMGEEEEQVLFTDHTAELSPSESFVGRGQFTEQGANEWDGSSLDLEDEIAVDANRLSPAHVEEATADFEQELSSMIEEEDDLVVDSEQDLELVDGPSATAHEDLPTLESFDEDEHIAQPAVAADDDLALAEEEEIHPDWAPLDESALEQEAEQVENPYAEHYYAEEENPEEAEGHDLYVEDEEEVAGTVVGGQRQRRRVLSMFASLAASLAILASGAVVVMRPSWLGLSFAPERVPSAQVTRPEVKVTVSAPALPSLPQPQETPTSAVDPNEVINVPVDPATQVTPGGSIGLDPVQPQPIDPVAPANPGTEQTTGPIEQPHPVVPVTAPPVEVTPTPIDENWPVPVVSKGMDPAVVKSHLVRINDHVLLGDTIKMTPRPVQAVDGMVPGSRAFAQLHNGNYFIGSVKTIDGDTLTLKIDTGEVSIPVVTIARLTQLGSRDFEELQKVTSGSIRLTNNNRLVGSILSGIADDHVVLEFRSNRVMLPKSVIGDILQGKQDADVRLDTTREEDDWLRLLVERELGTGLGAPLVPAPQPGQTPPR